MAEKVTLASQAAKIAELEKEQNQLIETNAALAAELEEARASSARQADQLVARGRRIEALEAERDALAKSLRGYKSSATKARNEATLLKAQQSPEARKIGALPPPADDAARDAQRAAIDAAIAAGPVTLVFSDGRKEVRELAPLIVTGEAWRRRAHGLVLQVRPTLEPGDMARPKVDVAGVALLDEAGAQVGWRGFPESVEVPRHGRVELAIGSIFF